MAERINNVQDVFLNALRKARTPVTLFLMKGIKLQGVVTGFDTFSVLLQRDLSSQLVYKHAISTIMPSGAIADFDPGSTTIPPVSEMQDEFLAEAARQHDEVSLFLMNGVMLQGTITGFDPFSLLLDHDDQLQLVYKHAVSTIQPVRLPSPKPVQAASIESPAS